MSYTKGPWIVEADESDIEIRMATTLRGEGGYCPSYSPQHLVLITDLDDQDIGYDEALANARLISASPTLLEACQAALANIERLYAADISNQDYRHTYECLKAAIAKATATEGEVGR